jgi:uncharacterized protein YbaR (Trm112 family)
LATARRDKRRGGAYDPVDFLEQRMSIVSEQPVGDVDRKLLEILVCPLTKTTLEYDAARQELISRKAKLAFPIRDGIPIMLVEEARRLD